ncbi:thioredoxin family protein [Tundrisphaera sp. TA3]|uniref:thioredoxin family protein n=1 Tax=Tundrisphaera sp. TA3 TaxID=3435775 RepID=UPI003EC0E709
MTEATEGTLDALLASPGLALVCFYAPWAFTEREPVEAIAADLAIPLVLVSADRCSPQKHGVYGLPTFWLMRDGEKIAMRIGTYPAPLLKEWIVGAR